MQRLHVAIDLQIGCSTASSGRIAMVVCLCDAARNIQPTRTPNVSLHISCDWIYYFSGLSAVVVKPSEWKNTIGDSSMFPELAQI